VGAIPEQTREAPVAIAVVGMGERQARLLEMVLSGSAAGPCVLVPDERAQAYVVDLDGYGAREQLHRRRRLYPGRPALLTGLRRPPDTVLGEDLFVAKPIGADALAPAVRRLCARVRTPATPGSRMPVPGLSGPGLSGPGLSGPGLSGRGLSVPGPSRSGIDRPATPDPVARRVIGEYEPDRYLQGLVTRAAAEALARRAAVHLEGPWPTITLLPGFGTAVVGGGEVALDPFAGQYGLPAQARITFTPAPQFKPSSPHEVRLEALLWRLALGASAGRVPEGTALHRPVTLAAWPNLTRLAPTPGALAIAALWMREAAGLDDTAVALGVPLPDVGVFYSAVRAVGLVIDSVAEPADRPRPTDEQLHPGPLRAVFDRPGIT
jgi:hypothetical protein